MPLARMPEHMIVPPVRHIKDLSEGETAWTDFTNVRVDERGETWLDNDGRIVRENFMSVKITRLSDESFCVVIQRSRLFSPTWTRTKLVLPETYSPVSEVLEEDGDYFDRKYKAKQ